MPEEKVISISIALTKHDANDDAINVVERHSDQPDYYSVYTRRECGEVDVSLDFPIGVYGRAMARNMAVTHAATLSMEHQAFIEPFRN